MSNTNPQVLLNQGMQFLQAGQPEKALPLFLQLEQLGLKDARLFKVIGGSYERLHRWSEAEQYFERSLALLPAQAELHNAIARFAKRQEDYVKALTHYRKAMDIQPTPERDLQLGLCCLQQSPALTEEANACFQRLLNHQPDHADAMTGMARIAAHNQDEASQHQWLEKALAQDPTCVMALSDLAWWYKERGESQQALGYFERLRERRREDPDVWESIALSALDIGDTSKALQALEQANQRFAQHAGVAKLYAALRFELGDEAYLSHYHNLPKTEAFVPQRTEHAALLIKEKQFEQAAEVIEEIRSIAPHQRQWRSLQSRLFTAQNKFEQAAEVLAIAEAKWQDVPDPLLEQWIGALLAVNEFARAQPLITALIDRNPHDQYVWALQSVAWRQGGDERYHWLCDYDRLVRQQPIIVPKGYSDLTSFNQALRETLFDLHTMQRNPLEQSLDGGTQTAGTLLAKPIPIIQSLRQALLQTMQQTLGDLPFEQTHPTLGRVGPTLDFSASWSVRLNSAGFHHAHIHTKGWYSSAYYVDLPRDMEGDDPHAGWLHLGQPGLALQQPLAAERWIKPEPGTLALFPSFVWHGTQPFHSDEARTTVAFDVLPKKR
ncbi:tetratricopeptide repeat protein [Aestuariibacter halophilus]|uniref:Tetratricopeptide repeat protein n=1 Tax=Fluctibacter halophilus TaxID=226011 RepID=A0ABS8GAD4_9ALTE|nr:putative 2OG-Fe(II) oxygenase [Aestuariibacter halophilus]MCC2616674.1 tetratricopeptide repeat protein [Aestuariibacter halophilus]